jgi:hypothetical protein
MRLARGGDGAGEERGEAGGGFYGDALAGLFVAVEVHAFLLVPEGGVDELDDFVGVLGVGGGVGLEVEVGGDDGHRAQLADEVAGEVDAFDLKRGERAGAGPLVVGAGGVAGVPDGQAVVVVVVGEPLGEVFGEAVVVVAAQPLVVVVVLLCAEDDELGEEGLEVLAVARVDERAADVAVGLLAVEELLEVGEAPGVDAVVGEVEVLEVEVPIVELVVGVAGEEGGVGDAVDGAQAVGGEVGVEGADAVVEVVPLAGAELGGDVGLEGLRGFGGGRGDGVGVGGWGGGPVGVVLGLGEAEAAEGGEGGERGGVVRRVRRVRGMLFPA